MAVLPDQHSTWRVALLLQSASQPVSQSASISEPSGDVSAEKFNRT